MKFLRIFLFLLSCCSVTAQRGFRFPDGDARRISIPFQFVNNLIVVPVEVNGVELNFLLDTGVDETILFSLDDQEVAFNNVQKVKLKGLGSQDAIEGLKSSNNILKFQNTLTDWNHDVYIVLDESFNVSSNIGIPVNGILGYHFFEDNLVEINYEAKRITVYPEGKKVRKKLAKNFKMFDISIEKSKPYLVAKAGLTDSAFDAKLLIDTGSSDAIWLFSSKSAKIKVPERNFDDYLGRGFSGEIFGKRARMGHFSIGTFHFHEPIASFPDSTSIRNINMVKGRVGSVGGEILKRFTVVFDYKNRKLYLKSNGSLHQPFHYNMSGMEVHHVGVTWVRETVKMASVYSDNQYSVDGDKLREEFTYKVVLKPVYAVSNLRDGSPAAVAGIQKNDEIVAINNKPGHHYSLQEILSLMKSEDGREITIDVKRAGVIKQYRFNLKAML